MNMQRLIGVVIGVLLAVGLVWFFGLDSEDVRDESCVAGSCCHAKECAWESEAPDCGGMFCTMSCEPETMDCGAGHCGVVDGECGVAWNE